MPTSRPQLGDLERAVMDQLWLVAEPGRTVREVHEALGPERDLAYTTVLTVLDRLAKKGLVSRVREGRAWRYHAAATREELTAQAMRSPLGTLAAPERREALLHFLDGASADELDDLRDALAEVERRRASG